jgi:hypothetical protein
LTLAAAAILAVISTAKGVAEDHPHGRRIR